MESTPSIIVPDRPSLILPNRPRLIVNDGKILATEFAEILKRWREELNTIFAQDTNEHATWPPKNALDCFQNFSRRPQIAIEMAQELATIVLELEGSKGTFGDRKLYDHQMGHLKWLVFSLFEGGTSYVIEGAPGTGKTIIEGFLLMAATRLQMRGILQRSILCTLHRPFTLSQQALSRSQRIQRIRESRSHESKKEWEYLLSIVGADEEISDLQAWRSIEYDAHQAGIEHVRKRVLKLLTSKISQQDHEGLVEAMKEAELLLTRQCALVADIGEDSILLPFPMKRGEKETDAKMRGDLGMGIPEAYFEHGLIYSRSEVNRKERRKPCTLQESSAVIIATDNAVFNHSSHVRSMLADIGIVIIDEGHAPATAYQEEILKARGGDSEQDTPLVFMASALSTTNGIGARPHAHAYSPRITIAEAIDRGVLPDVGIHHFPPSGETLYSTDTEEALEQFIEMHFRKFKMPAAIEQYQPYECHSVVVTDSSAVDGTILRLRQEYEERKLPATIVPFKGNTTYPKSDRVLLWMMEEEFDQKGKRMAKILVSPPSLVVDALSITGLENITIATAKGVGCETLERIFGRLQHSGLHRLRGERYRGYFIQGLYQETVPEATLLPFLQRSIDMHATSREEGTIELAPLQTVLSERGKVLDERTIQKKKIGTEKYPMTKDALKKRRECTGKKLRRVQPVNDGMHALLYETQPVADFDAIAKHSVWNELMGIANNPRMQWSAAAFRTAFVDIVMEKVFTGILPPFMQDERRFWEQTFRSALQAVIEQGPVACIACMLEKIEVSIAEANARNRFSVPKNIVLEKAEGITGDNPERLPTHKEKNEEQQEQPIEAEYNDDVLDTKTVRSMTEALDVPKSQKRPRKKNLSPPS